MGLALVIATDPKMLIERGYTSPFNVTVPLTLGGFPRAALDRFKPPNVWEWTEDCCQDFYLDAPADGSARLTKDCMLRVVRGGSWGAVVRRSCGPLSATACLRFVSSSWDFELPGCSALKTFTPLFR